MWMTDDSFNLRLYFSTYKHFGQKFMLRNNKYVYVNTLVKKSIFLNTGA